MRSSPTVPARANALVSAALTTVFTVGLAPASAAAEPETLAGDLTLRNDAFGRAVLTLDRATLEAAPDGVVDDLFLLAPVPGTRTEVRDAVLRGAVVYDAAAGFVAVFDGEGVERVAFSTAGRRSAARDLRGVELVRVHGPFEGSPWSIDTSRIGSVVFATDEGRAPETEGLRPCGPYVDCDCQSGGYGATSCGRKCTGVLGAGETSCTVSCGSGYYACCNCDVGLVASCYCKYAPRVGESGRDGGAPAPSR